MTRWTKPSWLLVLVFALIMTACSESTQASNPTEPSASAVTTSVAPVVTTTTLSPLETRAGKWEGATEFGGFTFTVSPDGTEITHFDLGYGKDGFSYSVSPQGDVSIPIEADHSVELQLGDTAFEVQFSDDGSSATGYLEMEVPLTGTFSEEWEVER